MQRPKNSNEPIGSRVNNVGQMKWWILTFAVVCLLAPISCRKTDVGRASANALSVEFSALLQHPQDYAGKLVRVSGFLRVEFEGKCLYISEEAYLRGGYDACLWVDVPLSMTDFDLRMVVLEGTFAPESHGHLGLWRKGSILGVRHLAIMGK